MKNEYFERVQPEGRDPEQRLDALERFAHKCKVATKGDFVDFLQYHYPDISRGGHRAFVRRKLGGDNAPWDSVEKTCPKCDKHAEGADEVLELFGTRDLGSQVVPQSYCRECR